MAAFCRRLGMVGLQMDSHQVIAALFNVRSLVIKYPKLSIILEQDMLSTSVFRPELVEPEHSCGLSAPMWELATLSAHYHPTVAMHAKHVAAGAPSAGPGSLPVKHARAMPHELYEAFNPAQHGFCFNPPLKEPLPHPLEKGTDSKAPRRVAHVRVHAVKDATLGAMAEVRHRLLRCWVPFFLFCTFRVRSGAGRRIGPSS